MYFFDIDGMLEGVLTEDDRWIQMWQNRDSDSGLEQIDVFIRGLAETQLMEQLHIPGIASLSHLAPQDDDGIQ